MPLILPLQVYVLQTVAGAFHPSTAGTVHVMQTVAGASHPCTAGTSTCTTNCSTVGASHPSTAGTCATNCSRCLSSLHCEYMYYKLEQMPLTPPLRVHVLQTVAGAFLPPLRVHVLQIVAGSSHPSTAGTCATNCIRCLSSFHCRSMCYKL